MPTGGLTGKRGLGVVLKIAAENGVQLRVVHRIACAKNARQARTNTYAGTEKEAMTDWYKAGR